MAEEGGPPVVLGSWVVGLGAPSAISSSAPTSRTLPEIGAVAGTPLPVQVTPPQVQVHPPPLSSSPSTILLDRDTLGVSAGSSLPPILVKQMLDLQEDINVWINAFDLTRL